MTRRETYGGGEDPGGVLPEAPVVGWARFVRAEMSLGPHRHDAYEICLIVDGEVEWWAEGERHTLRRGEVYLTRPGETHGGVDALMHPCTLYWVQVLADARLPEPLRAGLEAVAARRFPASPRMASRFEALLAEHRRREELALVGARAALHALLVEVLRDYAAFRRAERSAPAVSPPVVAALTWMRERLGEPFRIEEVAAAVELHPARLYERFAREVGETPGAWRLRRRIEAAQALLQDPANGVTATAHALGFSSSQYFATAFKRLTGRTPTQFRQAAREEAPTGRR